MLEASDRFLFVYVVARDFGFAPNPFHCYCTLATCKPDIRKSAKVGDWIMGVGGSRLKATGRCIYLMKVTEITTFDEYWRDDRFGVKKPIRNGSLVMMVGDNIYHRDTTSGKWIQEDSHHSRVDGAVHQKNLATDTRSENVLISTHFYYFGCDAPEVDLSIIEYKNVRNFRKLPLADQTIQKFVDDIETEYNELRNTVAADPFDFARAYERVDQSTGKLS